MKSEGQLFEKHLKLQNHGLKLPKVCMVFAVKVKIHGLNYEMSKRENESFNFLVTVVWIHKPYVKTTGERAPRI